MSPDPDLQEQSSGYRAPAGATSRHDASLFDGTAEYYSRYRAGYPAGAIDHIISTFDLSAGTKVLDIGAGTGQVAAPLASRAIPVLAIEPDVGMVATGASITTDLPVAWLAQPASCLSQPSVRTLAKGACCCTMGSSFHWMDRPVVAQELSSLLVEDGGIAVLSSGESVWRGQSSMRTWTDVTRSVIVELLGEARRAGRGTYSHPTERHQDVLAASAFSAVTVTSFTWTREIDIDGIIGLQLSTSYASPRVLGDRLEEFRSVLRERLLTFEPSGIFTGDETCEVIVARRP